MLNVLDRLVMKSITGAMAIDRHVIDGLADRIIPALDRIVQRFRRR